MQLNPSSTSATGQGELKLPMTADIQRNRGVEAFKLPPLILHPFSGPEDTSVLMESSRASLALQGFLPRPELSDEDLNGRLLRGRYAELRMLFYIGKDLSRWIDQCVETVEISDQFVGRRMRPETFVIFLVQHIPSHVRTKLEGWGVVDFCALFRRSVGLHTVFHEFPSVEHLSIDFLRRYHRHLDLWYEQRLKDAQYDQPRPEEFTFDLFASGEYTSLLEQSWGGSPDLA